MGNEEEDIGSYLMTLKEGKEYWKLKEEALDRTMWRTGDEATDWRKTYCRMNE
jgi:hypothetical protein